MLLSLINREAAETRRKIAVAATFSGIANASIIAIMNLGALHANELHLRLFMMLIVACALYAVCLRECVTMISSVCETALYNVRCRIADKIRRTELQGLERIGRAEIYERVTQQTTLISNSTWTIALAIHAAVMLAFTGVYVLYLSRVAFMLALFFYGGGGMVYYLRRRKARAFMREATAKQIGLFGVLTDLLNGFKEVRLRSQRGDELFADIEAMAASLQETPLQMNLINQRNYVFARLFLFMLLSAIVFVLPELIPSHTEDLSTLTAALIFMFGPLGSLLTALPEYERADLAAENVWALEARLDQAIGAESKDRSDPWKGRFQEVRAEMLEFQHTDAGGHPAFSVGPLSLTIRAGEVVFLVGGNGSGKTTLLKLLTTLYTPSQGGLYVDGVPVGPDNVQGYRELIAAIFGDFHLFKKLYGLKGIAEVAVEELLKQMQIAERVDVKEGVFSNLELSTGQRKRLAMVVALLEDRPLYVFDEWAADQDPEFRRYYYEELLQELKRRGKTVIAISHDDRYYSCADRVITMEYGKIRSIQHYTKTVSS